MSTPELRSVAEVAADIAGVVRRMTNGETHAFAFGDGGVPEAVIASYGQYDDLDGDETLGRRPGVVAPDVLGRQLPELVEAIRRGTFGQPMLVGIGDPVLVVMSTQQYRTLRGDDEPPAGVVDDPTVRSYDSMPTPGSKPFSLQEWARDDPFTQQMLAEIRRPTLYLTVGLPGTGKTTWARRVEGEVGALRLTKDEWMKALYGDDNPEVASDVVEGRLIGIGLRGLELGVDVVIDFGLWSREERDALRDAAARVGARAEVRYFEVSLDEQRRRLDERLAARPEDTWPISDDELASWAARFDVPTAGELDGSDPVGDPPDGFAGWREWIADRWPPAVGKRPS
ncbi:AAA family ATPase [Kribbella sp. NPDC059898]|uniref:AAA family ATPase n=1 Tax=Kribbella sp. NPDC059898 TaxID=3346995 RepID=UPI003651F31B